MQPRRHRSSTLTMASVLLHRIGQGQINSTASHAEREEDAIHSINPILTEDRDAASLAFGKDVTVEFFSS